MSGHRDCVGIIKREREYFESIYNGEEKPRPGCLIGTKLSQFRLSSARSYYSICDELSDSGIPVDVVYQYVSKCSVIGVGRIGLIKIGALKHKSPIRKRMMDYLFKCCTNRSAASLKGLIEAQGILGCDLTDDQVKEHYRSEFVNWVLSAKHRAKARSPPEKSRVIQRDRTVECEPVHRNILLRMNAAGYGDDEYGAFCTALKWAVERLETEKGV